MKKIYYSLLSGAVLLSAAAAHAQCGTERFHDFVFAGSTVTSNITYGSNVTYSNSTQSLKMDVYEPTGDVSTARPLVIVAHGGSFVGGSKTGTDVVPLCKDFAKLGYVAASIDYRLGMTHFPVGGPPDSTDAGAAVMRAVHDGRAAIRWFKQNARIGGNTYKIDTNNIYFAGVSAGGFIALHIAYMDHLSEFPSYVDTTGQYGLHGGIEGQSGNPGYDSRVKAIVNICGALGDTTWMQAGDTPLLSLHGNRDNTVPYGSAEIYLLGVYPLLQVDGSSSVALRADHVGIENCFKTYYNQDHVPEVGTSANNLAYYDTTIVIARNFLEHQVCSSVALQCGYTDSIRSVVAGINELSYDNDKISVYPNPASTSLTVNLSNVTGEVTVELYNMIGEKVKSVGGIKNDKVMISRDGLKNGVYMLNVRANGKLYSKRVVLE